MAKFMRQVEFNAYQFNPKQLEGLSNIEIEDIIIEALGSQFPMIPIAFKTTNGQLVVALHPRDEHYETVKTHTLNPWEWLVNKGEEDFCVMTNEELQNLTAVVA